MVAFILNTKCAHSPNYDAVTFDIYKKKLENSYNF